MLKKLFWGVLLTSTFIMAESKEAIEKLIGNMFIVGFNGTDISSNSPIVDDINRYHLAGVILFSKNINSPKQLSTLTTKLHSYANHDLLIAVDQEGGKVQRLSPKNDFSQYPNADSVARSGDVSLYKSMARGLKDMGINFNLAPVVDLALNPKNRVIVGLKRSFGSDPKIVASYAKAFIKAMSNQGVLTSLKHFPGHGSSLGDTHQGFVDVTKLWQEKELEPYRRLIDEGMVDTIMVAHVFNKQIDSRYPASLSYNTITKKLRGELGYNGVVISDDLQMRAISQHYGLKDTIALAINSGMDILLFCNQLDQKNIVSTQKLIDTTYALLQEGKISLDQIKRANERIKRLKSKL
ncbi:MAG: beta-N-acetylhexosaminidase [Campylobacterales bacterium]|nr:beta-N-acetylhexosaminidase [Campylobacterales bacterium]